MSFTIQHYQEQYELMRLARLHATNHVLFSNRYTEENRQEVIEFQNKVIALTDDFPITEENPTNYLNWIFPDLPSCVNEKDLDYQLKVVLVNSLK